MADDEESFVEVQADYNKEPECRECGKGTLKTERLGVRTLVKCRHCEYSKFEKPKS